MDAISAVEPFLTAAEDNLGANVILPQCQGATSDPPLSGYFATAAWVAKYPATARALAAAMDKTQALADGDRAAVERILPTYIKISKTTAALVSLNSYPTTLAAQRKHPRRLPRPAHRRRASPTTIIQGPGAFSIINSQPIYVLSAFSPEPKPSPTGKTTHPPIRK